MQNMTDLSRAQAAANTRSSTCHQYDVFLCHASADKPAVETLAHKLGDAGLILFLDKWHLIPGQPWQEALEEALQSSRSCAVFLGPGAVCAVAVLDPRRVVSASYDRSLRLWDVEIARTVAVFTLDAPATAITVVPGRRLLVAGDASGTVHFLDLIEPAIQADAEPIRKGRTS